MQKDEKIIILHDTFLYKWWGERLILMMWKTLKADIASWFFSSWSFDLRKEGFVGKIIPLGSEVFKKGLRHLKLKYQFFFRTKFLKNYNVVIFSGDSLSAVRNCSKNTLKIYYCHTPPRYIYDLHELYKKKVKWYLLPFFTLWCTIFRFLYEKDIAHMDIILTNSKNTQARIQKFLGYNSTVLYPPVDTKKFIFLWQKSYFLSFARLADAKRVDKIVEAFQKIPNEKLIIIYGKNDPQKDKIFKLSEGYNNIECLTLADNNLLYEYVWYARATIYIPIDEDFWMSPVESMSAGKPVLWVEEWGLKETIIHKETWYLLPKDFQIEDIVHAVWYLTEERCREMKEACQKRAEDFQLQVFSEKLLSIIHSAIKS